MNSRNNLGGIIHTYQKYDPVRFPSPHEEPSTELLNTAFDHWLAYGDMYELTEEQLAQAVRIDPSMIPNLGPSLESIRAILEERKRRILETYETDQVQKSARRQFEESARNIKPPTNLRKRYQQAVREQQLEDLESLWYRAERSDASFARQLMGLLDQLGQKYEVDELAGKYDFTGRTPMTVPEAIAIKEELEKIDELLEQLKQAQETAQIGIIDMEALEEFLEPGDVRNLSELQQQVQNLLREMAERQGLEQSAGKFELTPKAYRLFQSKLLEQIFANLQESKSGRHDVGIVGEGAVEGQSTKSYEFGDSIVHMDIPGSIVNAMIRSGGAPPNSLHADDIVIHRTKHSPKSATSVVMDMSGSMRYGGLYINVKRMALALEGLIRTEYPGDRLQFIEMATFARPTPAADIVRVMPKPVTIFNPVVRLKADMSDPNISEFQIPPHFTNIQHALRLSRQFLAHQDTINRQVFLITDGLPTAHFDGEMLYLLYPADDETEKATMKEAMLCAREGIVINIFLLSTWNQSREDIRFAHRMAEQTRGRVLFTAGRDLERFVIWDYLARKQGIVSS